MSTLAAPSLGARLRAERERRGFTLEQVSVSTKIPVALLEALERDDLSRWPQGFYRRALFRAYVTTLGLQPEPLAVEFARLFPDGASPEPRSTAFDAASPSAFSPDEPPALMSAAAARPAVLHSLVVALVEVAVVLAAGGLIGWATGMTLLTASGAVALVYYPSIRAGAGRTRQSRKTTLPRGESTVGPGLRPTSPEVQPGAGAAARLSAAQRLRSVLATVRTQWTRAWHVMRHAAVTTRRRLSGVATWASVVLWRAGTVARHGARKWFLLAKPMIAGVSQGSRRAGTRAWRVMRHAAAATYRMSSRVVAGPSVALRRAGTATSRALERAARQMGRVCVRGLLWAKQAFWRAIRIAAGHAEQLAARQLNHKSE
jgi:transcriptional regulator with XRE-family HTH domain